MTFMGFGYANLQLIDYQLIMFFKGRLYSLENKFQTIKPAPKNDSNCDDLLVILIAIGIKIIYQVFHLVDNIPFFLGK